MATSTSWAQDVITCDLCDKAAQQFCNSCQVSLCESCVKKHRDEVESLPHDIVPFLERKIQVVFPAFKEHTGQRCEVNCKKCNKPVCVKCIGLGSHKGHVVEELTKTYENKLRKIKSDTEEIKAKLIPKYPKEDVEIGNRISKSLSKFDDLGNESKTLRKLWHQEVDDIFDKIDCLNQSLTEENLNVLQEHHNKIRRLITEMNTNVKQNETLFNSNIFSELNEYKSKLKEYYDFHENVDLELPSLSSNTHQGKELFIEIGGYRATLKHMSLPSLDDSRTRNILDKVRIITTIPTPYEPLDGVVCVGEAEAWVYGDNETITRIDIHGIMWNTVTTTCLDFPGDISVTRGGELIFSDRHRDTVNIVRQERSETLIKTPQSWNPEGLCCTRSGDVLVHVSKGNGSNTENKIIRYHGQNLKQEINKDGHGNPIFKDGDYSLYMSENNNLDVCVSDVNADTVIVVKKTGKVRFRYDGKLANRAMSFGPRGIVTDSLSHIIMTDYNNDCLHILDQYGQFLRCVDDIGLKNPSELSVDNKGRLWVGCDRGEIKVVKYLEH